MESSNSKSKSDMELAGSSFSIIITEVTPPTHKTIPAAMSCLAVSLNNTFLLIIAQLTPFYSSRFSSSLASLWMYFPGTLNSQGIPQ